MRRRRLAALGLALALAGCGGEPGRPAAPGHGAHGEQGGYLGLVEDAGPRAALSRLQADSRSDPAVASACHHHAHQIGTMAYALHGFPAAARDRNDLCVAGYIHGVLEAYVGTTLDLPAAMGLACAGASARTRPGDECYHGVGHGLMKRTKQDRVRSLALCGAYPDALAQGACRDGVWMAAFSPLATESGLDPDAVLRLCRAQPVRDKASCYRHGSTNVVALDVPAEYAKGFRWCRSAEPGYAGGCVTELGAQLTAAAGGDPALVETVCMSARTPLVSSCIDGMAIAYHPYYAPTPEPGRGLCARLRPANQAGCRRETQALDAYLCPAHEPGCVPGWQSPAATGGRP